MRATKLRGPAIILALAIVSSALVLGQDPLMRTPPAPGPHPLQTLGRPVATATAERPGFDLLVWRRDFATLSSAEYRGAGKGTDVVLQGKADALEALLAIDADTSPSSIVLSLAADRGLTLGVDGAAAGLVAGVPVRVSASFYQSRDGALTRVPGGLVVSGTQIALWAERGAAREPVIVSVRATFGTNPETMSAVAAFGVPQLTATVQVDADGNAVASPGDTLRYQLRIPNIGDAAMTNVAANLPLDAHTAAVAGSLNVSPIALDQDVTINEDTAVPITLTGSDADGNALTYTVVTQSAHGVVVQGSPGGAGVTYTPAANFNGTDTFTVRNNDGRVDSNEAATITVTVGPVNDAPSFTKGPDQSVVENSPAQSVTGWATAISPGPADESGQTILFEITNNTAPALFSVPPSVSPAGTLTYTPAATFSGTATISIRARDSGGTGNGGVDVSPTVTFTIEIRSVNEAPSFTKGADQTVLEDSGVQTVPAWATGISAGVNEITQTVTFEITGNTNAALFAAAPAVASNGTLTYTPAANANGAATITLRAKDDGGTADGGVDVSATQTFVINVTAVNDAPSFTVGADQTNLEDSGAHTAPAWATAIAAGPADEASQTLTFAVTNNTNAALFAVPPAVSSAGALTYTFAPNMVGAATITLRLSDNGGTANSGADTSATQTFVITTTEVNDAPSFTAGANQTVLEDAGPQTVAAWATALSPGPNEPGQVLTFEVTSNTNAALFSAAPAVIGTNGNLTFTPAPNAVGTATITLRVHDDGGTADGGIDVSPTQSFTITVDPVNDAPSFTKGADATALEDSGAQTVAGWATAISKGGPDESGQTLTFVVTNNTNGALFSAGPAVNGTNGNLTFTPAPNAHGTATITLRLNDNGGTLNGGLDQSPTQTFDITITNVNDAPSFTAGANQTVFEDAGAQTVAGWATALSPGPNESGQVLTFEVTNNSNLALFSAVPVVNGATGTLTYTPAPNAVGTATITLRIHDDGGAANGGVDVSSTQPFTITVDAVNDAPSFTAGANQTVLEESGAHTVPGWATAISKGGPDESGQTLTFVVTNNSNAGLFAAVPAVAADGTLTFTPAANAFGTATITLRLDDNGGTANGGVDQSATQTFDVTVTNVNDAPSFTAGGDQTVLEDAGPQTVNGWATAISAGPNEGSQTVAFAITNNTNTALFSAGPVVSPTGVLTYTPAANANGSATVTLRLTDNGGTANSGVDASAAQTFVINVTAVNDNPVADDDAYGVNEGGTLTVPAPGVLDGDTDVEGSTLSTLLVTGPLHASSFALNADGSFSYTHDGSETTTDTFTYRASDGALNSNVATVTITVTPVNDAPVAAGNAYGVNEGAALTQVAPGVLAGDTDAEGNALTAVLVTGPAHSSSFTLNPDGSFSYTHDGSETPLSDSFTYRASDGVALSNVATVTITITPVNDPPVINLDADGSSGAMSGNYRFTFNEADPTTFLEDVTDAVITDADHTTLTSLKVTLTNRLDPGFEVLDVDLTGFPAFTKDYDITTDPAQGVLTIASAVPQSIADYVTLLRKVTYSNTDAGPNPADRIVTFVASDGTSNSAAATTTITVITQNQAPSAADDSYGVLEGGTLAPAAPGVLAGDTDPDGDTLTAVLVTGPAHAASFTLNPDGSFTYVHDGNGFAADSFTYRANDGLTDSSVATVTITVTSVNDAPTFTKGPDVTVLEDSGAHTTIGWATAMNPGGAEEAAQVLTFVVTNNTNPTLFSLAPAVNATTGTLTFTPSPNAFGSATITLRLDDNGGTANGGADQSATQTFVINVTGINDAPSFVKGADQTVLEDAAAVTVNGWATAISAGPNEGAQSVSFEITNNSNAALFSAGPAVSPAGALSYTLAANANGSATITLRITDNGGTSDGGVDVSATQTFNVTVTPVNDAPSYTKGADETVLEDSGAHTTPGWATAMSAGPADESGQTLTFTVTGNTNAALFSAAPAVNPITGDLTYTPAANANGSATITLRLDDNGGTANGGVNQSPAQTFVINVTGVNDAPSFTKGADQTVFEDATAVTVNGWATAISAGPNEGGQSVSFEITGTTNPTLFSAGPSVSPTGVLTYTPAANENGTAAITLRITDNGGTANGGVDVSVTQTFNITVTSVNDAPSYTAGAAQTVLEDSGAQTVPGWATAMSPGPANESAQTLSFNVTNNTVPASLTFSAGPAVDPVTGTLTYTPAANAHGSGTFNVILTDNGGTANGGVNTVTHILTINVTAVNDAPTFTPGANQTSNEDAGAVSVSSFIAAISSGPNETGQTVSFTITGNTNTALFTGPGAPAISSAGTLTYTAAANANGVATITYHASDNGGTANGGVDTTTPDQSFTITVNPVNDPPTVANKNYSAQTNMPISFPAASGLLNGATDPDNGVNGCSTTLTVVNISATSPASGIVTLDNADGSFTFTPPPGVTGDVTFTYQVQDNGCPGNATSAAVTVTVNVSGPVIWFVDDNAAAGGNGTLGLPFNTLAGADAVDAASHRVFLYNGTYATGLTMNTNEWLVSQGASAATFDSFMGISPPAGTLARPAMGPVATSASVGSTVTMGTSGVLNGIAIASGAANGFVANVSSFTVVNTTVSSSGLAVSASGATPSTATFTSVTSTGGATGISLANVGGTWSFGSGALTNNTTAAFVLTNSAVNAPVITYSGNINPSAAGRVVDIGTATASTGLRGGSVTLSGLMGNTSGSHAGIRMRNSTAGTLTFSNTVNGTSNTAGVTLTTNPGATVAFTGNISLSTSTGAAFTATGGGTVTTNSSAINTISTSSGQPLLLNTITGPQTWRSINVTGSATNGISVSSLTGAFTIAGTGAANSGGTITNVTNRGAEFITVSGAVSLSNMNFNNAGSSDGPGGPGCQEPIGGNTATCNAGIFLSSTSGGVSLSSIHVDGGAQVGINGLNVTNLTMNNVEVENVGNDSLENGVLLKNTFGTGSIANSTFHNNVGKQVYMYNNTGTLTSFNITNSNFSDTAAPNGAQGLLVYADGASTAMTVSTGTGAGAGNTFNNLFSFAWQALAANSAQLTANLRNATLTNTNSMVVQASLSSHITTTIDSNNWTAGANTAAGPIALKTDGGGDMNATVTSNTLGQNGVLGSGTPVACGNCIGIFVNPRFDSDSTFDILGNTIQQVTGSAIDFQPGETNAANAVIATITGNLIRQPIGASTVPGVVFTTGVTSGPPADNSCLRLTFGGSTTPGAWPSLAPGAKNRIEGDWDTGNTGVEVFLFQRFSTVFNLAGYPGTGVNAYVASQNSITSVAGLPVSNVGTFTNGVCLP